MKIKYKKRLVSRAEAHKEADRYIASSYIEYLNGPEEEFKGCEIGCLATPSDLKARKAWFKATGRGSISETVMIRKIEEDFGVCATLQRVAERFLMELPEESTARLGGFVVSFVKAIPEGRDITNDLVTRWILARGKKIRFDGGLPAAFAERNPWYEGPIDWDKERAAFLDWLRRGAPEPRVNK